MQANSPMLSDYRLVVQENIHHTFPRVPAARRTSLGSSRCRLDALLIESSRPGETRLDRSAQVRPKCLLIVCMVNLCDHVQVAHTNKHGMSTALSADGPPGGGPGRAAYPRLSIIGLETLAHDSRAGDR